MAKKKLSVLKRARQSEKRRKRNQSLKSELKTYISKARKSISSSNKEEAKSALLSAIKKLDKAVSKKIIHKRTAARKKSRLTKQFNAKFLTTSN